MSYTITIPRQRGPGARLTLLGLTGATLWLIWLDLPMQQTTWPDPFTPIGQLQYAVVALWFVVAGLAGILRRRISPPLPPVISPPSPPAKPIKNSKRFAILKRDGYRCQLCGRSARDGVTLEIDHKIARSKGGTNDPSNLWTLCATCNNGKSDSYL